MTAIRTPSGLKEIVGIALRDAASVLQEIETAYVRTASGLKTFFSSMSVSASAVPTAYGNSGAPADITTQVSEAIVTGGVAPYTYLWTEVGSPTYAWTIINPPAPSTPFRALAVDPVAGDLNYFKCTVTDANGKTVDSNLVACNVVNLGGG